MTNYQWLFFAVIALTVFLLIVYLSYFWHRYTKALPLAKENEQSNLTSLNGLNQINLGNSPVDDDLSIASTSAISLAILRQQYQQAEQSLARGEISQTEFSQLEQELQSRIVEEAADQIPYTVKNDTSATFSQWQKFTHAAIWQSNYFFYSCLAIVVLSSLVIYLVRGDWRGMENTAAPVSSMASGEMSEGQIRQMVARLERKLVDNPEDIDGWAMLARSYKVLKDYPKAIIAYEKCAPSFSDNANFLVDYAQTIAQSNQGNYIGKSRELLNKAIKISPQHQQALLFSGLAAAQAGEHQLALQHWQTLLPLVADNAEITAVLKLGISNIKKVLSENNKSK